MKEYPATLPMTVEMARQVHWPFREIKGQPIGYLLDNGLLTLQDLGFAIQRAYDKRVREAARILLHHLTDEPDKFSVNSGPLNVVSSERRSFAEGRQLQITLLEGTLLGMVMGASAFYVIQGILSPQNRDSESPQKLLDALQTPQWYLVVIAFILIIVIYTVLIFILLRFMSWTSNRFDKQRELHHKGQRGEERVLNVMYHSLDGDWWAFRNLAFPGRDFSDIDFVLVGPTGIWALEVKSYGGEFRTVGDTWERKLGSKWVRTFKNPTKQVKRNATTLHHVLKGHDIKQWVNPVVIWANPASPLRVENPSVAVWKLDQLTSEFPKIHDNNRIPPEKLSSIIETLKSLYKEPFSSDTQQNLHK